MYKEEVYSRARSTTNTAPSSDGQRGKERKQRKTHPTFTNVRVNLRKVLQLMQNVLVREIDNQGPKRLQQNINQINRVIRENNASTTPLHVIQLTIM